MSTTEHTAQALSHASQTLPAGFENVDRCDLCGGSSFEPATTLPEYYLFTGEVFQLIRCHGCSLHFVSPRPTSDIIGRYYDDDYPAHRAESRPLQWWQRKAGAPVHTQLSLFTRLAVHVRESVAWFAIPRWEGGGRILDLGCGSGQLLDTMKKLGWETHGVEPSPQAAERARAKGHHIVCGTAEQELFEPDSFDVVYMWHVLEHTHSPTKALAHVHRYLRPGGRIVMAVPNYASFHSKLFGRYWSGTEAPRHLYQFDRATLRRYLQQAGFQDIQLTTRTGSTSWVRGFRNTINGVFGTRLSRDPAWLLGLFEVPVAVSSLFKFFGVGGELRVVCRKPGNQLAPGPESEAPRTRI
jgi:2-polyprenyl-3-methyl-5-hydroxy-6-metoxy-1,4-benzoquinol methylase